MQGEVKCENEETSLHYRMEVVTNLGWASWVRARKKRSSSPDRFRVS